MNMKSCLPVKTSIPLVTDRIKITRRISKFWDTISRGMEMAWGPHIHHGYYDGDEILTPVEAQEKLIDRLADMLKIIGGSTIADVGCGIGGSSIYLAGKYGAQVSGITLSPVQAVMARARAKALNTTGVTFMVEDALDMKSFKDGSFDIVWSLESCEQFFDKGRFLSEAGRILKENGQLMLATWCSGKDEYSGKEARAYKRITLAFDLPYMPSMEYYLTLLKERGFTVVSSFDWSDRVKKSWDIGISAVKAYSLLKILAVSGFRGLKFSRQIRLMQRGFRDSMVRYGVFICRKTGT